MERPRAIGHPAVVLGVGTAGSAVTTLLGAPYVWRSLSGLANVAGTLGGLAVTLIGLAILQRWGEFA